MINWMKLVGQGRAKAYGISWTEEEIKAITSVNPAKREFLIKELRAGKKLEDINISKEEKKEKVDVLPQEESLKEKEVITISEDPEPFDIPEEEVPVNAREVVVKEEQEKVKALTEEIKNDFGKLKAFSKEAGIDVKIYTKKAQMLEELEKIGITL